MGGLVIVTVRPGVQFTPAAASAFRRAEAQVLAEFGRLIDVNSTYRSWATQLDMWKAWNAYVAGNGPHPGHSKAVHPSESFHVSGLALDSDDWINTRIVQILAENGFIRNRLYVPNERHHFEYIESRDQHRNDPVPAGTKAPAPAPKPVIDEDEENTMKVFGYKKPGDKRTTYVTMDFAGGLWDEFVTNDEDYAVSVAKNWGGGAPLLSIGHRDNLAKKFVMRWPELAEMTDNGI